MIAELQLTGRVLLPGAITDVAEHLSKAKLFVLSSNFEGMPNALMEAMAVGVPCISTDCPCGGPKALIRDGIDGFLIPCKDLNSLENAIRGMLVDEDRELIGTSARHRAALFNEETIYKQWDAFLFSK